MARGPVERVPACVVLQLPWAHRALRLAPVCNVPAWPALPGAGTVRGWACGWHPAHHSFPNLFTSNQTNPSSPALNGDCAVSQDDRRAAVSMELPSVGFTRDRCLAWPLGTSEATLDKSVAAPQKVKPGVTTRLSRSAPESLPRRPANVCLHGLLNTSSRQRCPEIWPETRNDPDVHQLTNASANVLYPVRGTFGSKKE